MTDRAQPGAIKSLARNDELAQTLGQFSGGWIVSGDDPTPAAQRRGNIDETALNAFAETSGANSLTVTIDPGEAFVDGWLARDISTDIDLAASTNGQTVFVGWDVSAVYSETEHANRDDADTVIVGLEAAFGDLGPKVPLWTFDTDDSGVTAAVDERYIGQTIDVTRLLDGGGVEHTGELADASDLYTEEEVADIVGALATDGLAYDDAADDLSVAPNEVDASEFAGDAGSSGEYLTTDGTSVSWTDILQVQVFPSRADIPTDLPAGTIVFAEEEQTFYGEDGV